VLSAGPAGQAASIHWWRCARVDGGLERIAG
jgi:hypothetical protein